MDMILRVVNQNLLISHIHITTVAIQVCSKQVVYGIAGVWPHVMETIPTTISYWLLGTHDQASHDRTLMVWLTS